MSTTRLDSSVMEASPEHPEMLRGKLRRNRKYGRNDFERFDHLASSYASLGSATIGKVHIDCRFLFTKSKWGVMGKQLNQAGIIYLDLTFHEPKGYRLHSATVTVTLDDKHKELDKMHSGASSATSQRWPVQMTDCYGPKGFMGPEKSVQRKKAIHFNPNVQVAGFGGSLADVYRESASTSSSRWRFSGHLLSGENQGWRYDTLQWELSENDLETQSTHSNVVHTAFAFQHGGQPFFMRVDVEGKLKALHDQLRNKLSKFLVSTKKDDGPAVTLINFGNRHVFTKPLDSRAKDLHFEMEQANLQSIPMEVLGPQQVTFQTITPNVQPSTLANGSTISPTWKLPHSSAAGTSTTSQLEQRPQPPTSRELVNEEEAVVEEQAKAPTLANLARIINSSFCPESQRIPHQIQQLNRERPIPAAKATLEKPSEENAVDGEIHRQPKMREDPDNVVHALYMPGFLPLVKLLVVLRSLFNWIASVLLDMTLAQEKALDHEIIPERGLNSLRDSLGTPPPERYGPLAGGAGAGGPYNRNDVTIIDETVDRPGAQTVCHNNWKTTEEPVDAPRYTTKTKSKMDFYDDNSKLSHETH